jgi:hypothetical protein
MKKLTQKRLKELLRYDPATGIFRWKISNSNRIKIGNITGCITKYGYLEIVIDKKNYKSHRLAFLYMNGYFPENDIDHINRLKTDNRWINLREVSRQCNIRNSNNYRTNTSGIKGVSWHNPSNKWMSYIYINNKRKNLGYYKSFDNAVCARLAGEQCLDWAGCDSNSLAYQYIKKINKKENL